MLSVRCATGWILCAALCAGCSTGESVPYPSALSPAEALRAAFPEHAAEVLGAQRAFVLDGRGFVRTGGGDGWSAAGGLDVVLPVDGSGALLQNGAFEVRVRERRAQGEGAIAEGAVVYAREGGRSFWHATDGGIEEWLHLGAGRPGGGALAVWEVEGGALRQRGEVVEIADRAGVARIRVTAPRAYARGGREVRARLTVREGAIELSADAGGEEVLIDPSWVATGAMNEPRFSHSATRLLDGRVLVAGGGDVYDATSSAEIYDPVTNAWSLAASMPIARYYHLSAVLGNGKVLLGDGTDPSYLTYDPLTDTWASAATPPTPNWQLTSLQDGRVLGSCQYLYDPATDTWSSVAPFAGVWGGDVLPNGTVFCGSGIYDPTTDTWTAVPSFSWDAPWGPECNGMWLIEKWVVLIATMALSDGKELVVHWAAQTCMDPMGFGHYHLHDYLWTHVYDPAAQVWTTGNLYPHHNGHYYPQYGGAALADGTAMILVPKGWSGWSWCTALLYSPSTDTWQCTSDTVGDLPVDIGYYPYPYARQTATLLTDGTLLHVEKYTTGGPAHRYGYVQSPLGAPCLADPQCVSGHCADGVCCATACNAGACDACSVAAGAAVDGTCALFTGPLCDDGNACTQGDTCQAGVCSGGPPVMCPPPDACHVSNTCDPPTGLCVALAKPDGTWCDDGVICTKGDTCQAGVCSGGPAVVCPPPDACHVSNTCEPQTGVCVVGPAKADGTACDDGDVCTKGETCKSGECGGGLRVCDSP